MLIFEKFMEMVVSKKQFFAFFLKKVENMFYDINLYFAVHKKNLYFAALS